MCLLSVLAQPAWSHDKIQDEPSAEDQSSEAAGQPERKPAIEDPADIESPSDLQYPLPTMPKVPKVRVELRSGKEFRGDLIEPTQFRVYTGGGAYATWSRDNLERMVVLDTDGLVQAQLRDGRQIVGKLITPYVTLKKDYGKLSFARSRLKIVEDEVAVKVRQVKRPQLPDPADDPAPSPFVREPFVPAAPYLVPDVFTKYPGVPTWHAAPVDLNALKNHYPRNYYGK